MMKIAWRDDFHTVLPTGIYILASFVLNCYKYDCNINSYDVFTTIIDWISIVNNPERILIVLFISYILGSIVASFPTIWVQMVFRCDRKTQFPESIGLDEHIKCMSHDKVCARLIKRDIPVEISNTIFNYWKNRVCMESPDAFHHYRSYEAASRFFACMFWAGGGGALFSVVGFLWRRSLPGVLAIQMIVSILLIVSFGGLFLRVRGKEANVLFSTYIALLEKQGQPNSEVRVKVQRTFDQP